MATEFKNDVEFHGETKVNGTLYVDNTEDTAFRLRTRLNVTAFPVPNFSPTATNTAIAFDVMPNGTPTEVANNGFAWMDICDGDFNDSTTVPATCARVGVRSDYVEFSSRSFNGGTIKPIVFNIGQAGSSIFEAMRITSTGNVGIGNPTPAAKLDVTGDIAMHGILLAAGWLPVADTWTYASASTITIPTDGTLTYQKGDYLRWKQGGGYKYGTIASLTATVITIIVNTDYTITNSAITDIAYSRAANPQGWPQVFNFTSTQVGFSSNPSVEIYRYSTIGRLCTFYARQNIDGVSNSTSFTMSLPVTAATITNHLWSAMSLSRDNNVNLATPSRVLILSAGTTAILSKDLAGTAWTASGTKNANFQITYEF